MPGGFLARFPITGRQRNGQSAALDGSTLKREDAAVGEDNITTDGQPQPCGKRRCFVLRKNGSKTSSGSAS